MLDPRQTSRISGSVRIAAAVLLLITVTACDTEEVVGPEGAMGPEGPIGPAGEDGTLIHAGYGEPDEGLGEPGDYYFDLDTGILHGPKSEGDGWSIQTDLMGPQGPPGGDGSRIHSDDGEPDESLGELGDFYLNTSNYDFYGPKTEDGWGTPINLQGPPGPEGPQGPAGEDGEDGEDGKDGEDGEDGNANVTIYDFPGHDFSAQASISRNLGSFGLSPTEVQESGWLFYLITSANRHDVIPGRAGLSGNDVYRVRIFPAGTNFNVHLVEGSGEEYETIRAVQLEATEILTASARTHSPPLIPEDLDTSDFGAVLEYFGVDESEVRKGERVH